MADPNANRENVPVVEAKGARIPLIGLGTWDLRGRVCARVVEQALRLGYRHVDTAEMYDNEREVGEGVHASGVKRNEVFVTTKIWPSHFAPRELERAARDCLVRLRLSEVDLLLLHWPNPQIPLQETLGALCKVKRDGLARNIGVSNFTVALLDEALQASTEPLMCNQFECHPFLDQSKLIAACRRHGMAIVAYARSPKDGYATTRHSPAWASPTKRPPRRSVCAFWSSKTSSSFRAPAKSSGWRRMRQSSILSSASGRWLTFPRWRAAAAASSTLPFPASRSGTRKRLAAA
jgi:diketogulonate reductase-like aldo/keto reductase